VIETYVALVCNHNGHIKWKYLAPRPLRNIKPDSDLAELQSLIYTPESLVLIPLASRLDKLLEEYEMEVIVPSAKCHASRIFSSSTA
jgi:hypothetical protein